LCAKAVHGRFSLTAFTFNPSANVGARLLSVLRNIDRNCAQRNCEMPWLTSQFADPGA
jgi:hypothetical protein